MSCHREARKEVGRRCALAVVMMLAAFALAACGGNKNLRDGEDLPAAGMDGGGDQGMGMQSGRDIDVRGLEGIDPEDRSMFTDPDNPLSTRIIYFDLDSSAIPSRFSQAISAHGRYLSEHPDVNLRLEGHTDERGTREYNMALGERRANAVRDYMVVNGIPSYRIESVSYGEERPIAYGSGEANWSQNRRVELK